MPSSNNSEDKLINTCESALASANQLEGHIRSLIAKKVFLKGRIESTKITANQFSLHGYAWLATYVESLRQLLNWSKRLKNGNSFGDLEQLILKAGFGEYLAQIRGGIPMSQLEIARLSDFGANEKVEREFLTSDVMLVIQEGNSPKVRQALAELMINNNFGNVGLQESSLEMIRDQFKKFSDEKIAPHAQTWHMNDSLIPDHLISDMSDLGVFGLTIPEKWGGSESGKTAMCLVTEELCRGYLGVGSLVTRTEIAADLIREHGTDLQKLRWLAPLAEGKLLPTALFTEPDTGSDLASVGTRAIRSGTKYQVTGAKTWATHASRADLMTVLVRTEQNQVGHKGVSILVAPKPRGTDDNPFPLTGMSGTEIKVIGYRGMKEYEIAFDGFEVPTDCLLGEVEGQGFKQLMSGMETARIQTAARAIGVAQNALELGLSYSLERYQFGRPIYDFPRISAKLTSMMVEIMICRQLTWSAAREKDAGRRCDIEAGMAKLLSARVAWSAADNAMQIHGGNGYAVEFPISRVLMDSRILNVFEGTGEIQAQIISKRLLETNQTPAA